MDGAGGRMAAVVGASSSPYRRGHLVEIEPYVAADWLRSARWRSGKPFSRLRRVLRPKAASEVILDHLPRIRLVCFASNQSTKQACDLPPFSVPGVMRVLVG